ncbi:LuxR family transcriptional regulator [Actinoallomurus vinaceus]|uniref:LuxR family transcriptional regulator n=1 Tax=Actinoallomurus vinaceus TaxID=1080074 RepID=A0ABP8UDE3_9ACTN
MQAGTKHGLQSSDVSPSVSETSAGIELGRSRRGWRGRTREWRLVEGLLRAAQSGRGGVLLVEGRSGIGKSRLLAEAIDAAAARGFTIARGAADESAQLAPLKPLISAFGESARTLLASRELLFSDSRLWLVDELQDRLEAWAARGPCLVAFDDLQWADPTTLFALRSLVPELASYPLVWILVRTAGAAESGADRLYEVLERDGATLIELGPLGDDAVAEIVTDEFGAAPDPELLALAAGAAGNPFLLVEWLKGLRDEAAVEITDGHLDLVSRQLPRRVQEIARSRLGRLSPPTRHLLQVAAVLGHSFSADDLADVLGEQPSRLLSALEEAQAAGAVVPCEDRLAFRHDLLWRAVAETITVSVRQALHRQVGEILLKRGGSAIPAVTHLLCSAQPEDTAALAGLDRAAHELLPTSAQSAADVAIRALELTALTAPERFDRTGTALYSLATAGRLAEATKLARTALGRTWPPEQVAHLYYELAYLLMLAGRPGEAVAEAERALAQAGLPAELRGLAEQVSFQGMFAARAFRRGRDRAQAVVTAEERHTPPAIVGAHILLAGVDWTAGRAADAIGHLRTAIRVAGDGPIQARHAHPRLILVNALSSMRRLEEAEAALESAAEEITALGHTAYAAVPAIFRAKQRIAEGRLDDAATEAQAGLAIADQLGMHAFDLVGIAVLAIVAARRGDIDTAVKYAEQYRSLRQEGHWSDWAMALVAEAQGGPEKAIELYNAPYTDPAERTWLLMFEPAAAAWLTRTALAVGSRSDAETIVAAAGHLADGNPEFPTLAASEAHARGILHRDPAALAHAVATHVGSWERASAAEDLGALRAHEHGGSDQDAISSLDQALEGYQRTGALRDAARVRARLRDLGVRRRHWTQAERPLSGWESLTETEGTVAALVAQGLTNPQVARQMFISPQTVKFHLRQVFRKLGIASRVELARLTAERTPDA